MSRLQQCARIIIGAIAFALAAANLAHASSLGAGTAAFGREDWARIRDAVGSKMSLAQRAEARRRAIEWRPWRNVGGRIGLANCGQL